MARPGTSSRAARRTSARVRPKRRPGQRVGGRPRFAEQRARYEWRASSALAAPERRSAGLCRAQRQSAVRAARERPSCLTSEERWHKSRTNIGQHRAKLCRVWAEFGPTPPNSAKRRVGRPRARGRHTSGAGSERIEKRNDEETRRQATAQPPRVHVEPLRCCWAGRVGLVRSRGSEVEVGRNRVKLNRIRANVSLFRPKVRRFRAEPGRVRAKFCRDRAKVGRVRAKFAESGRSLIEFGQTRASFGRSRVDV